PIVRPSYSQLTRTLISRQGQHAGLQQTMSAFTSALLGATPAIAGLDETIVVPPRRLHFTLGVMSLDTDAEHPGRTLDAAKGVLARLRPALAALLAGRQLRVKLDRMDIMKPERRDPERAHVLWVGPAPDGEGARRLKAVAELVVREFRQAGLLVDEGRALKASPGVGTLTRARPQLHCTVLNTVYRRPRGKTRVPFSYPSVLETVRAREGRAPGPVEVDFGEWGIEEVQICEMGSWGQEGEYVAVGRCPLL
ncbi:kinase A anchor protein, partial [Trametes elegans]